MEAEAFVAYPVHEALVPLDLAVEDQAGFRGGFDGHGKPTGSLGAHAGARPPAHGGEEGLVVDEGLEGEAGNGLRTRFQGSNVDDAVEGGTSVEGTGSTFDYFNVRDGFHRNQRPGGLCSVGRQEGEAVEQHLNA